MRRLTLPYSYLFLLAAPLEIINLTAEETPSNSQRTLVFVGVMTSKDFLETRAKAVYNTWGKLVPGRIAFFSSESSSSDGKHQVIPFIIVFAGHKYHLKQEAEVNLDQILIRIGSDHY